jgi:hypothetical protein
MPVGRLMPSWTVSGPSSDSASRIVKPAMPAIVKPPSTPTNRIRWATGVVVSSGSITR